MAEHIIEMRPEGANDYGDIVYPKTKANAVIDLDRFGSAAGTNTYTVTIGSVPQLYTGLRITVAFANANTGASTLNVNGLGAKTIIKAGGSGLSSGNIKAGSIQSLVYNGTSFQLLGEGGEYGTATQAQVLTGYTIGTDGGVVSGTMPNRGNYVNDMTRYDSKITLASGYYSGGTITSNITNLSAANIKNGTAVGGITGTYKGLGNAVVGDVLAGKTFSTATLSNSTGTMVNRGAVTNTITTQGGTYTIPQGYHSGSGKVAASFSNLVAGNVKSGVNIGGVVGSLQVGIVNPIVYANASYTGIPNTVDNYGWDSWSISGWTTRTTTSNIDFTNVNFIVIGVMYNSRNDIKFTMKAGSTVIYDEWFNINAGGIHLRIFPVPSGVTGNRKLSVAADSGTTVYMPFIAVL